MRTDGQDTRYVGPLDGGRKNQKTGPGGGGGRCATA